MTIGSKGGRVDGLFLRLTEDEAAALDRAAAEAGLSRQDFLRRAALGGLGDGSVPPLVGGKEAAEILGGLTKQQMHSRSQEPGFPEPVQRLARGPIWRRADIEALAAAGGAE